MGIRGDVRSIPLANVLQDLVANEQTGTLAIRHKDRHQLFLWFDKGALKLVGLGERRGPSLLNGLLALEKIGPDETPTVTGRHSHEGGFIRGLLKKGRIAREDLKAALEHQMGEHLCDVFLWSDASFEFEEGEPDDRHFDVSQLDHEARLAVEGQIMEALRRADEWGETRKAILSWNEILVPDPGRLPAEAEASVRRVFALLDGERSLKDLQVLTRLGQFMLMRAAALLIRSGAARPLSAAEAYERARARASKKEWELALRMARFGLEHERKNLGLLELALKAAETLQQTETAASYARQLASAQAEGGQPELAIQSYQRVLVHAPRDLTAHERLFEILLDMDLKLDALAAGEALAAAYKKAGLPDKALDVYTRLIARIGDHSELLESVAEIQRHLGDRGEAVKLYARLLERAMESDDDDKALDHCRTILKHDPRHEEAAALRERLESGQVEKSRKRRRVLRSAALAVVALAGAAGAVSYEARARDLWSELRPSVNDAVSAKGYRDALRLCDTVIERYRWSLKVRELQEDREDYEQRYFDARMERVSELEAHGQLPEAIAALGEANALLRSSRRRGALNERLAELQRRRESAEKEWGARLAKLDPKELALVRDPLAVPALVRMLGAGQVLPRFGATSALGQIEGEGAVAGLIRALADPDASVQQEASGHLVRRGRTPFAAALIGPKAPLAKGEAPPLEWRVTNLSPAEVELILEEPPARRLKAAGPGGDVALPPDEGASRRAVRLGPGEYVGGTFADLTARFQAPGRYQAAWAVALSWNGKPFTIAAPPLAVDRK
jgi:tetratricopeptide (TPR) repeat protein